MCNIYAGHISGETSEEFHARQLRLIEHESAYLNAQSRQQIDRHEGIHDTCHAPHAQTHAAFLARNQAAIDHESAWMNRNRDAQLDTHSTDRDTHQVRQSKAEGTHASAASGNSRNASEIHELNRFELHIAGALR